LIERPGRALNKELAQIVEQVGSSLADQSLIGETEKTYYDQHRFRYHNSVEILLRHKLIQPGFEVLDCGAFPFQLSVILSKFDCKVDATDKNFGDGKLSLLHEEDYIQTIRSWASQYLRRIHLLHLEDDRFDWDEQYDLIVFSEVLEHLVKKSQPAV